MLEPHWIMSTAMAGLGGAMLVATIGDIPALYELRLPRWLAAAVGKTVARYVIAGVGLALVCGAAWVLLRGPVSVAQQPVPRTTVSYLTAGIG